MQENGVVDPLSKFLVGEKPFVHWRSKKQLRSAEKHSGAERAPFFANCELRMHLVPLSLLPCAVLAATAVAAAGSTPRTANIQPGTLWPKLAWRKAPSRGAGPRLPRVCKKSRTRWVHPMQLLNDALYWKASGIGHTTVS